MKTIFKPIQRIGLGVVGVVACVGLFSTSSVAIAITPAATSAVCTRLPTLAATNAAKINQRLDAMQLDFQKRLSNLASRIDVVDQKVATSRMSLTDKFDSKVSELKNETGVTPVQLAAIEIYEKNMKDAETARATAVDTARGNYRTDVLQKVTGHQAKLLQAALVFQRAIDAAFTKAQANCEESTATTILRTEVKAARNTFQGTQKADEDKLSIKQFAETRGVAIKTANTEFAKKTATATTTLKTELSKKIQS
ncbi:MAG: surface antigen [Candidatus Saccharibacteria bacterium]|nr:surface antigen [Candidatus Saccharibacteria bacterium]